MKTKLHNYHIYAEGLVQSPAGSLVISSVSVILYEPKSVDSVGFLMMPLTLSASTIPSSSLLQDSLNIA